MTVIRGLRKGAQTAKNPVTDLSAYPILTEEVGYPPSPLAKPFGGQGGGSGTSSISQMVSKAMGDVLGWKIKAGDTKGFMGALTQSFSLTEVEGHVESKWTPRSYIVQSDLSGGITGAQASVYTRGKEALDQSMPLLDGLYTLVPEADTEDVAALKAVVKSQFTELVNELGFLGGPRISRVNQYFKLLMIDTDSPFKFPPSPGTPLTVDPDQIGGTLGNLRDILGLSFTNQDFVNSVEDEQNLSNYRIVSDYLTSLAQSWLNNLPFLGLDTQKPFFGTQLVLLSRQLLVVAESVDEVRFTLDSVFVGPSERQSTEVRFPTHPELESLFLEDLLSWVRNFSTDEGPSLIQDGGKFGVQNTVTPMVKKLLLMVSSLPTGPSSANPWPPAFFVPRVRLSLDNLVAELKRFLKLAKPIEHDITSEPDFGLPFQILSAGPVSLSDPPPGPPGYVLVQLRGNGFQATPQSVTFSGGPYTITSVTPYFRSESLLMLKIPTPTTTGTWDVTVVNADSTSLTLRGGFAVGP
ncbi:MAG TPA: hypothetical protein VK716_08295 [Terracidiphilus sp.]|jgi:hypothetical protein|nr:hypothetical protein [Terracidiphilus sp.]